MCGILALHWAAHPCPQLEAARWVVHVSTVLAQSRLCVGGNAQVGAQLQAVIDLMQVPPRHLSGSLFVCLLHGPARCVFSAFDVGFSVGVWRCTQAWQSGAQSLPCLLGSCECWCCGVAVSAAHGLDQARVLPCLGGCVASPTPQASSQDPDWQCVWLWYGRKCGPWAPHAACMVLEWGWAASQVEAACNCALLLTWLFFCLESCCAAEQTAARLCPHDSLAASRPLSCVCVLLYGRQG